MTLTHRRSTRHTEASVLSLASWGGHRHTPNTHCCCIPVMEDTYDLIVR